MTTLDSDALTGLGVVALAAGVGGAFGNWWLSLVVVGLALLAGAYARHVDEQNYPAQDPPDAEPAPQQPAAGHVPHDREEVIT